MLSVPALPAAALGEHAGGPASSPTVSMGSEAASSFNISACTRSPEREENRVRRMLCRRREPSCIRLAAAVPGVEAEESEDAAGGPRRCGSRGHQRSARARPRGPLARRNSRIDRAVRRGAHGVDGEVAARRVLAPVVGERDLGVAAVGPLVAPERGDFVALAAGKRSHRAVLDATRDGTGLDAGATPVAPTPARADLACRCRYLCSRARATRRARSHRRSGYRRHQR